MPRIFLNNLRSSAMFTSEIEEKIHIRVHSSKDTRSCSYVHCSLRFPRRTAVRWENRGRPHNGGGGANIWATPNAPADETHSNLIENRRTRLERQLSTDTRDAQEKAQLSSPGGGGQKGSAGTSPPNRVASASASGSSGTPTGAGNGNPVAGDVVSRAQVVRIASGSGHEETRAALLVPALNAAPPQASKQPATLPLVNTAIMSTVRTSVQHASPSTALDPSEPVTVSKQTQTGTRAGPPPAVPPKPAHLANYQRGTQPPAAPLLAQVTFASSGSSTSTFSTHVNSSSNPNHNQNPNQNEPSKSMTPPGSAATQPLWTVVEAPGDLEYDRDRERDSGLGSDPRSPPHAYPLPSQSLNAYPTSTTAAAQAQAAYPVGYPSGSLGRSGARTKPSRDGRILINLYDNLA